ncbi:mitochondrial ribosomal protein L31-domain-containing protein [Spinellus fusiger]|nr:mitochondrial ribosomal protein L31-domain-containing protein [Spinellus fusiger]
MAQEKTKKKKPSHPQNRGLLSSHPPTQDNGVEVTLKDTGSLFCTHHSMFGAFRPSLVAQGGLLWKNPFRMSATRKANVRKRLRQVDEVIATVAESGVECKALKEALALPKESEMHPRDKYTIFSRTAPGHRKSLHKLPKFTKKTARTSPAGF